MRLFELGHNTAQLDNGNADCGCYYNVERYIHLSIPYIFCSKAQVL